MKIYTDFDQKKLYIYINILVSSTKYAKYYYEIVSVCAIIDIQNFI
jgi:hypothetical protein